MRGVATVKKKGRLKLALPAARQGFERKLTRQAVCWEIRDSERAWDNIHGFALLKLNNRCSTGRQRRVRHATGILAARLL